MRFRALYFILSLSPLLGFNQVLKKIDRPNETRPAQDTLGAKKSKDFKPATSKKADIADYKIFNSENDTISVDTTLSIQKFYKYNYLRKDNFDLLQFPNIGQTYNRLTKNLANMSSVPLFGARARHFNYYEIKDTYYYYVPTPFTELMYKSAFKEGQLLDAIFAINPSRQLNLSIAYKGLRSLGRYQRSLTSTGNLRFTTNYQTKNRRYLAKAHIVTQDLSNNENGGLNDEDIINFRTGDEEFKDREVFETRLDDATNILVGKRFHLDHSYIISQDNDSLSTNKISIGNILSFEDKFYRYEESTPSTNVFGPTLTNSIRDKVTLEHFNADISINYQDDKLGHFAAILGYHNLNYGYNKVVNLDDRNIANRIKTDFYVVGATYDNEFEKLRFVATGKLNLSSEISGHYLEANTTYQHSTDLNFSAKLQRQSALPNFNQLLYQSDYREYNWDYTSNFENVVTTTLAARLQSTNFGAIDASFEKVENYTVFAKDENGYVKPYQDDEPIGLLKIKASNQFKFGKFGLVNTLQYQNDLGESAYFNVPSFITRNTIYFENEFFDKALFLQTGFNVKYFTEYKMDGYDPLLAEFYVQNEENFGGFPLVDFFVNAKIRQTRIFLIAEHFNSSLTGYDYFSAPNQPYRDFAFRFGLVWNFFL